MNTKPNQTTIKFYCPDCKVEVEAFFEIAVSASNFRDGCDTCGWGSGCDLSLYCPNGHLVADTEKED